MRPFAAKPKAVVGTGASSGVSDLLSHLSVLEGRWPRCQQSEHQSQASLCGIQAVFLTEISPLASRQEWEQMKTSGWWCNTVTPISGNMKATPPVLLDTWLFVRAAHGFCPEAVCESRPENSFSGGGG